MAEPNPYGTDKSELLQQVIAYGLNPIAITIMQCEETFVFNTKEEAMTGWDKFKNEGWWYGLEEFKKVHAQYVESIYEGKIEDAAKVYWLG